MSSPQESLLQVGGCPGQSTDCLLCSGVHFPMLLRKTEFVPNNNIIKVIKIVYTCNEYELTVHTVKSVFETGRGLGVTPSSAVGP